MMTSNHFARDLRSLRLFHHHERRLMVVPLDHSISDGPVIRGGGLDALVGELAVADVDAVVLHKGSLRHVQNRWFANMSLIVHLSASTAHAADPDAKYLVTGVEEALRLGADAVSVHVNLGSLDERRQIADLGEVADACDRWHIPLLAMMYPRGPKITNPRDPELVAHAAALAADLGADIVKTPYVGTPEEMAQITAACPIPLIVAGGPQRGGDDEVLAFVGDALRGGAAGAAMGRNVFQAADPGATARRVSDLVHGMTELNLTGEIQPLTAAG
ncbi:2-amino-3,7-dideoxy-D-threo-hept-6-ulosonate synthase [Streptomyces sp. NPDC047022]|uniref:2-amino-3,7-dideoxy-D-threo-hept-6-ulosonate synthase n=1 Tax=Streptomyces sp. NPDC047022 TaxID=3155737 RepID=UPI0033ECB031